MKISKYPFKKVLVTGGAGFIGSSFIQQLSNLDNNIEIVNIDNISYAASSNTLKLLEKLPNYSHLNIDITDTAKLNEAVKAFHPEILINFAAESHVDKSIKSAFPFINTNIIGTFNLLESIKSLPDMKKFLFHHVSTDEVYGDLEKSDLPFTESTQYKPSSPYSASKAASDMLVLAWGRTYKIPYLITNCSNNFGPRQFPEKFIPKIIFNSLNGIEVPIYGDGMNIRDWIYVEDHINALMIIIKKGKIGENYNIGSNYKINNINLVKKICKIFNNLYPNFKYENLIKFVKDRPGHDFRYSLNSSKIKRELNYKTKFNFDQSLKKTIKWYINNKKYIL